MNTENKKNKGVEPLILLVEDDKSIATLVEYNLSKIGYRVIVLATGENAVKITRERKPDVILLDWVLPDVPGTEICSQLRQDSETSNIPIIMISAKTDDIDKVHGLERGADDYLIKPFSSIELAARIKAVLRRIRKSFSEKKLNFADIEMDLRSYTVTRGNNIVKLAPIEFQLLQILMENPNIVCSRPHLINKIWGGTTNVDERTVDVHITRLRRSLVDNSETGEDLIATVRMVGYKLVESKQARIKEPTNKASAINASIVNH